MEKIKRHFLMYGPYWIVTLSFAYVVATSKFTTSADRFAMVVKFLLYFASMVAMRLQRAISSNQQEKLNTEKIINLALARIEKLESGNPVPDSIEEIQGLRWPWGTHDTVLLGHLEAAAKRFWKLYDPKDYSTAPTNQQVSNWLQTERNVSRTMADAIASILRADGLPTGPRK